MLRRFPIRFCTPAAAIDRFGSATNPIPVDAPPSDDGIYRVRRSVVPLAQRFGSGAGLGKPEAPDPTQVRAVPTDFNVIRKGTTLQITWKLSSLNQSQAAKQRLEAGTAAEKDTVTTTVTAELMRVCAPSTDVLSMPENVAISAKRGLTFTDLTLCGNYAVRVSFSDGHTAGIYGYQYLYDLSGPEKWMRSRWYVDTLRGCKRSRDPVKKRDGTTTLERSRAQQLGCGSGEPTPDDAKREPAEKDKTKKKALPSAADVARRSAARH